MPTDLHFYTNPMSRGRIVRWMLEEVGEAYETTVMLYGGAMKDPAYLAINPMGKVPAVRHGDAVITEAAAICAYLADAFPHANLAPPSGTPERAAYYRWLFFMAGPFEAANTNRALGVVVPQGREVMVGYGSLQAVLDVLETAVTDKPYVTGESFSAADVYVGAQLGLALRFKAIEPRPAFQAYCDKVLNRPAALRAAQIDDALIPAKK